VVGDDQTAPFDDSIRSLGLEGRVYFHSTSEDVLKFYACADAYVGPSIEDAYGLPVLEAMACGVPVIASRSAGVAEIIAHRVNGLVLADPTNASELGHLLRLLVEDSSLRDKMALEGALTGKVHTWDRSADLLWDLFVRAKGQIRK
jgi:glycosyltransferase involved in cell wall biosynthesis